MKKLGLLLILFLIYSSCQKNIIKYPNGKVHFEADELIDTVIKENKQKIINGHFKEFDTLGNLISQGKMIYGKYEGICLFYYPSGELQSIIKYSKGKINGLFAHFDEDSCSYYISNKSYKHKYMNECHFINAENMNMLIISSSIGEYEETNNIFCNEFGNIVKDYSSFSLIDLPFNSSDTLEIGKTYSINYSLVQNNVKDVFLVYGVDAFDENFNIIDSNNLDTVQNNSNINILFKNKGTNYLRGIVHYTYKNIDESFTNLFVQKFYCK